MSEPLRILVVEDETSLAAGLKLNLELDGYRVDVAPTAREAGKLLVDVGQYAVIILDVMLPDLDGFALCRSFRDAGNYTPVIMLTARSAAEDRVSGLEAGADDYLVKPFALNELMARIRSVLRRRRWEHVPAGTDHQARFGEVVIDFDAHDVRAFGKPVQLTQLELDLLRYFLSHPGRVLSREELLEKVWKLRHYPNTRTVDNFIVRLRKLFEPDPAKPVHFLSIRGAGYKFVPSP